MAVERTILVEDLTQARARIAVLQGALRAEHFRSNGSSVYMDGPQHERSIKRCKHPLCLALDAAEAAKVERRHEWHPALGGPEESL